MRLSIAFLLLVAAFLGGCGTSPESARTELREQGYDFSREGFTEAVADDDREAVELFIAAGISINARNSRGETAIAVASAEGYTHLVRLLVEAGAKPGAEELERTIDEGDWELSGILLEAGAKLTETALDSALQTFDYNESVGRVVQMLSYADRRLATRYLDVITERLDEEYAEALVEALLALEVKPSGQALANATEFGNQTVVTMLLQAGARPNAQLLENAVEAGDADLVEVLLEAGARPNRKALERAMESGDSDLVALLIDAGARAGGSALTRAVESGDKELVATLLESGTKPNAQALESAVENRATELIQVLLDEGVAPSSRSLEIAVKSGDSQTIRLLLEAGAEPDDGVLESAIANGDRELVRILIDTGLKPGSSTIEKAVDVGDTGLVDMLLEAGAKASSAALEKASRSGDRSMIDKLLTAGAKPTGVQILRAVQAEDTDLVKQLLAAGAKPGPQSFAEVVARDESALVELFLQAGAEPGPELLQSAVEENNEVIVNLLLGAGAKPNEGLLAHAASEGNAPVVGLLLEAGVKPTGKLLEQAIIERYVEVALVLLGAGVEPSREAMAYAESTDNQELIASIQDVMTTWVAAVKQRWQSGQSFTDQLSSGRMGPTMIVVPAGQFEMGCKDKFIAQWKCSDDEQPPHEVTFRAPFAVSKFEITFAEWDACVAAGSCRKDVAEDQGWGRANRPVVAVRWEDTQSYVAWLSQQAGEEYRLPSESEWEYFTRAGTDTPHSWKSELLRIEPYPANCSSCENQWADRRTAPVGSFEPNPFGLHDVHGNVWEWVEDCWNENYRGAPVDGSAWLGGNCQYRMNRGGSFASGPHALRSARRNSGPSGERYNNVGFRVVRKLTP